MSTPFNASVGLIVVSARLCGPQGQVDLQLALDTGATTTVIRTDALETIGLDLSSAARTTVTTGSGVTFSPRVTLDRVVALGHSSFDLHVIAHTIPRSAGVDGVLGLDFLRGRRLTLDFRKSRITLT
jgi:predicted aspartyl protease